MLAALAAGPVVAIADSTPVRLAIVVPIVVPEGTSALLSSASLEQYTSGNGLLSRELEAVYNRPVAIAIDPLIIASIRVLGSSAPKSAVTWLNRLRSASNESFALSFGDSNLTLTTQAGASTPLSVESLDFALDSANFDGAVTAPTRSARPSPTPEALRPTLPTTADLFDWPYSLADVAWPRERTVDAADLKSLATAKYTTAILASDNVSHSAPTSSSVVVGSMRALISDDPVSGALRSAVAAPSAPRWNAAMANLHHVLAASGSRYGGTTIFATLDRAVPVSASHLKETITSIAADSSIKLVGLSAARGTSPISVSIVGRHQPAAELAVVHKLLAALAAEQRFASVVEKPEAITSERRLRLLRLLSNQWDAAAPTWQTAANRFLADSRDLRNGVSVVTNGSFNLLADRGALPIAVRNDLDQEVTVFVNVRPRTAILAVTDTSVKLVLEPHSQGSSQVPVQAISNGTVGVDISLADSTGQRIGSATTARINVQAGWETPAVVVFALLVFAVFGFGIVRRVLRREEPNND